MKSAAWRHHPERSNTLTIRFIVWVALSFGRGAARLLLPPICLYFVLFSGRARRESRRYLSRALGRNAGWVDLYRHFHCFAATILDRVFLLNGRETLFDVQVHGDPIVDAILQDPRGCVFIGAHMGSFELLHMTARKQLRTRTWMVMYEDNARKLNAVLKGINPELNPPVIALGRIDSMLKIDEALTRGEHVGLLADRGLKDEKTIEMSFLGAPMAIPIGPFRLALILDRPVVLAFGLYLGGNRYEVFFQRLTAMADSAGLSRNQRVEAAAREYVAQLEQLCRQAPYNWFNFHDVWHEASTVRSH